MKTKCSLLARVPDGKGHFPFVAVPVKRGIPVAPTGATSFYLRHRVDGKRVIRALGDDLTRAYLVYANEQLAVEQTSLGLAATPAAKERISILAAAEQFKKELEVLDKSPNTIYSYAKAIEDFRASVGKDYLEDVTDCDLIAHIGWLRKHLVKHAINGKVEGERNATIANRLRYLRVFFLRFKIDFPLPFIKWPRAAKRNPDRYSMEHINKMLAVANEDEKDLIAFLLYTGFRDLEVAHAYYKDIDFRRGLINAHDKPEWNFKIKDHEQRPVDIPLPDKFLARMKARQARYPKDILIFPDTNDRPHRNLLKQVKEVAERAQLDTNATLHKFRRTFATMMAKRFGVRQAQAMLGHADLATTARYLSADDMDGAETKTAINQLFAGMGD